MEGKVNASDFYQLQSDHFHPVERDTLVPNDLDTGDILLFSRRCSDMGLVGAVLCYAAKQYSPWDHVCVIVKDPDTKKLYALEAALSGCQLYEVDDRINHSKAPAIAVRYLRITRTEEQRRAIWKLVNDMNGKPYMSDPNTMLKAGVWSPQKFKRVILRNKESLLKQQIEQTKETLRSTAVDPLTSFFLTIARTSLEKEYENLQNVMQTERKSRLEGEDVSTEFFCSHSVAHVLKAMNVLPASVPSTEYLPYSFSSEVELPLLRGASFSKELFLRGNKSTVFDSMEISQEQFLAKIQEAFLSCQKEGQNCASCLEDDEKVEENTEEPAAAKPSVPHEDVLSLLSSEELNYILTQLKMTRPLGRASTESLKQLLQQMKISYYLPGDCLQLSNADMVLSILLRGDVHFHSYSEVGGETVTEHRGRLSLLGLAAHPLDAAQLARITADDIAALGCASGTTVDEVMKEAPGIHKFERFRLIKAMRQHPAFQQLSFADCYHLSYYFYKVDLDEGSIVSREGSYQSFIYFVQKGRIERQESKKKGWEATTRSMKEGCFPGFDSILNNQPSSADYVVKEPSSVYVLNPSVFTYFTGGRFTHINPILDLLRNPDDLSMSKMMEDAIQRISFYNMEESVQSMKTGFLAVKQNNVLYMDNEIESRINQFVDLLEMVYTEETKEDYKHKEGIDYLIASGMDSLQQYSIPSLINSIQSYLMDWWYPPKEGETCPPLLDEQAINDRVDRFKRYHRLNDFSNEQILAILHSFQYKSVSEIAAYLLYLSLNGVSETCTLDKAMFVKQATNAGLLTPTNQQALLQFFFTNEESLSFAEFLGKLQSASLPSVIQQRLADMQQKVQDLLPDLQEYHMHQQDIIKLHRAEDNKLTLSCHSPFYLLPYPLPTPYVMTFALRQENPSLDYRKYVLGGLFGEVFGRFMLYPAYLSSFTHLLAEDITPMGVIRMVMGEKWKPSLPTPPPAPEAMVSTSMKATPANNANKSVKPVKPSKPIMISDVHSHKVTRNAQMTDPMELKPVKPQVKGVNPLIGGFSRYCFGLLYERLIQLTCFPIILRSIKDAEITADLSLPVQSTLAGALVGSSISLLKHPLDRRYLQRVLNVSKKAGSWKQLYAGWTSSWAHASLFNAIFFGTFTFFWDWNNRDYIHDHGFSHNLPHPRDIVCNDVQPVHYELLGKSIICLTCAYTAAQVVCYPFGVYRNMKLVHTMNLPTKSSLYKQLHTVKFFSKANLPVLYGGMWTRVCWSVLSCSMGIAFGSALLTKNYRDTRSYFCLLEKPLITMSTSEPPKPSSARPHRCAYLVDDIIDAMHPWNKEGIKTAYRVLRQCMKNPEVNADCAQKPKYVAPREGYEELFDAEKVKARGEQKREEERILKENLKKSKGEE